MSRRRRHQGNALKASNSKLQLAAQVTDQGAGELKSKLADLQSQLDESNKATAKMEQQLEKARDEANKLRGQVEEAANKLCVAEEKHKKAVGEMECQRHNADAARQALEHKLREADKTQKAELASLTDSSMQKHMDEAAAKATMELKKVISESIQHSDVERESK
jgi:chromosome segregation ATPase